MFRKVLSHTVRHNPGYGKHWAVGGSYCLLLECGHESRRKISQGVPKRARCSSCVHLSHGGTSTTGNVRESWDAATQMPKRETVT